MSHHSKITIRVELLNLDDQDAKPEVVEFTAADVLQLTPLVWDEMSEQDQTSFAEDYALYCFKRKYGDRARYRVDVVEVLDGGQS